MYTQWREVFDIGGLKFLNQERFASLETERGELLDIYSNPDRMETELLKRAPEDAGGNSSPGFRVRAFAKFAMPDPGRPRFRNMIALLPNLPKLPMLRWWSRQSVEQYGGRFKNPLLRAFFGSGESAQLSAIALVFSLAWMSERNAGYPIGGSQAIIRLIVENFLSRRTPAPRCEGRSNPRGRQRGHGCPADRR